LILPTLFEVKIPDSIGKAPLIFLTGAGASVPLGCLTSKQFVKHFLKSSAIQRLDRRDKTILTFTNWLRGQAERADVDVDIEMILQLLEANAANGERLRTDQIFARMVLNGQTKPLEQFIGLNQELRDALYSEIIEHFSSIDSDRAGELYRPFFVQFKDWFGQIPGVGPTVPFFTLNYDTAVEGAAAALDVRLIDGLGPMRGAVERRWSRSWFESYEEQPGQTAVVLFKLHGSVRWGWTHSGEREIISELPPMVGRDPGAFKHAVLYPTLGPKPVQKEPFRTGYRFLRACLGNAKVLFVIGCSLRDGEIQEALSDATDDNQQLRIVALSPDADHNHVAQLAGCDPSRVVAVRREFTAPPAGSPGDIDMMGSLRGYGYYASGDEQYARSFPFGMTLDDWPSVQHRDAIQRAIPPFRPRTYNPSS
jgi:hypothetical protein